MNIILAVLISQLRFIDYNSYETYKWPEDEYVKVSELRFVAWDDLSAIKKGDRACFVFEEVGPMEVCGTIRGNVHFGLWWVIVDLDN